MKTTLTLAIANRIIPDIRRFTLVLVAGLIFAGISSAQTQQNVVILDGDNISYQGRNGVPNHEILRNFLELGLPHFQFNAKNHFDVTGIGTNGFVFLPQDAIRTNPALVFVHWSAFRPVNTEHCEPHGSVESRDCSQRIVDLLGRIYNGLNREVRFIIYSRADNLCTRAFRIRLNRQVKDTAFASNIGLITISAIRGRRLDSPRSQTDLDLLVSRLMNHPSVPKLSRQQVADGVCILDGKGY